MKNRTPPPGLVVLEVVRVRVSSQRCVGKGFDAIASDFLQHAGFESLESAGDAAAALSPRRDVRFILEYEAAQGVKQMPFRIFRLMQNAILVIETGRTMHIQDEIPHEGIPLEVWGLGDKLNDWSIVCVRPAPELLQRLATLKVKAGPLIPPLRPADPDLRLEEETDGQESLESLNDSASPKQPREAKPMALAPEAGLPKPPPPQPAPPVSPEKEPEPEYGIVEQKMIRFLIAFVAKELGIEDPDEIASGIRSDHRAAKSRKIIAFVLKEMSDMGAKEISAAVGLKSPLRVYGICAEIRRALDGDDPELEPIVTRTIKAFDKEMKGLLKELAA